MTPEGRAVADVIDREGVWRRGGMAGVIFGLDIQEALATLPDGLDRNFAIALLTIAEKNLVRANAERAAARAEVKNG